MEDFGYSKQQEETATTSVIKRAFLIGATLFSVACFIYVTINAYYFFSQDNNANIITIKAEADPIKVTEVDHESSGDEVKIDNSIYEDIFGNRKYTKEKEVKIRESASPALPPKNQEAVVDKKFARDQFVSSQVSSQGSSQGANQGQSKDSPQAAKNKSGQIIVYSDAPAEANNNVLLENSKTEKRSKAAPQASPNELVNAIIKPSSNKRPIKVQVAALTSKDAANEYWDRLQRLYPGLFSGLKGFIEQVDLGKRGIFYRLQIGNFFDQVKAEEFCNRYVGQTQRSKADCIVVE